MTERREAFEGRRLSALLQIIERKRRTVSREPLIVAIDGRCASGKSTVATALSVKLGATLIHMDDFFLRPEQRTAERLAIPGENIDHERFLSEVLLPLEEGKQPFAYRPFSCSRQALGEAVEATITPVVIIEGSYALHPRLSSFYDLRIFFTVDPQEQLNRLQKRNPHLLTAFRERWIPLEEAYFSACKVSERAQIVVDTTKP